MLFYVICFAFEFFVHKNDHSYVAGDYGFALATTNKKMTSAAAISNVFVAPVDIFGKCY